MIIIENQSKPMGLEHAIRGMRNPMNSWSKSDSYKTYIEDPETLETAEYEFFVGENDMKLMIRLAQAGRDHRKFMRMITVCLDITAPLFWWKEFDTYKVGTVRNSCSTMHRIHVKEFVYDDFAHEGIDAVAIDWPGLKAHFKQHIAELEWLRNKFNATQDKRYWRALIEMLPDGFMMKATVMLNYEVLANMYQGRKYHKVDEWRTFCGWIESLPYSELITGNFAVPEN